MNSALIIVISIFTGATFAYLLYSKKTPWSLQFNIFLALFRGVSVALMIYMLLAPFFKSYQTTSQKSVLVLAIDHSSSVLDAAKKQKIDLNIALQNLKNRFAAKFDIQVFNLDGPYLSDLQKMVWNKKETDLNQLFNAINNNIDATDIKGLVLISDGIINKGSSPLYSQFSYPIFTLGIGDTTVPKDIIIKNCLYNKIVGKNNRFPISVEIKANGFKGRSVEISIFSGKIKIMSKPIYIDKIDFSTSINFENTEIKPGLKHYSVITTPQPGEYSIKNNTRELFFEVIEAKLKIAVISASTHPDIKAISKSLNKNENIETTIFIDGIHDFNHAKYDLVIAYQMPALKSDFNNYLDFFIKDNTPILFVLGANTNIARLNELLPNFKLIANTNQFDKVSAIFNSGFSRVNFNQNLPEIIENNPPLIVPFGAYNLGLGWETIIFQKVGAINTEKPLLSFYTAEGKNFAVLFGEGIWQWSLNEYAENQNTLVFDDLMKKLVTLLAQKKDKSKFRCNPSEKNYEENLPVSFKIETYNDIYDPVFNQEINIEIKDEHHTKQSFKFTNTEINPNFEVNGLKSGNYSFIAKAQIAGKSEIAKGEFSILNTELEDLSQVANFELLRNLSEQTQGQFFPFAASEKMNQRLENLKSENKIFKSENIAEIINLKYIFLLIIMLLSAEWGIRKFLSQV